MSSEPPTKKPRKGTRSCAECRHRKVRCDWPSEGAETCSNCLSRGRKCEAQEFPIPSSDSSKLTSRSRIANLEDEVSTLWKVVHRLETATGSTLTQRAFANRHSEQIGNAAHDDSETESSEIGPAENLPTHLGHLFDGAELQADDEASNTPSLKRRARMTHRLTSLIALLPPKDDMIKIAAQTPSWMEYNNAIFPTLNMMRSGEYMLTLYDRLVRTGEDDEQVIGVAAMLLSIAMTVQHAPDDTVAPAVQSIKDGPVYIRKILDVVDRFVLTDDRLAETLDGVELGMLYLRIQLSRTKLRKMWIYLRRIIALAEIISLPRASMIVRAYEENKSHTPAGSLTSSVVPPNETIRRKAEVWEAICTIDRIYSVIWSLPLATSNYPLPRLSAFDKWGALRPKPLLYNLADIASRVIDLDQAFTVGKPLTEQIQTVMAVDQELRTFAASTPQDWWRVEWAKHCPEATIQYWYRYLTVRAHFQLALASHGDARFSYNFITCLSACQQLAKMYVSWRPVLAPGFFANAVIDLQAFTGAIFLLLANYRATWGSATVQQVDIVHNTELTDGVLAVMSDICSKSDAPFARQGASAVRSLRALFGRPHTSDTDQFTLTLPLVGKVHVSRKSLAETAGRPQATGATAFSRMHNGISNLAEDTATTSTPSDNVLLQRDASIADKLSFSMEYYEDYPLLIDEIFANEDWLSWPG